MNEQYPQLLDKFCPSFKGEDEYGPLFNKYKVNELKGSSLQTYEEHGQHISFLFKKRIRSIVVSMILCAPLLLSLAGIGSIMASEGISLAIAYSSVPWLFWLLPFFFFMLIPGIIMYTRANKKFIKDFFETAETEGAHVDKIIENDLNFPKENIEIHYFERSLKKGKQKPGQIASNAFYAYSDNENVFFLIDACLLKIPKKECIAIQTINSRVRFYDMNTFDDPHQKKLLYRQHKIMKRLENGIFVAKNFGRLLFSSNEITWALDVLPYSLENAIKLFSKSSDN